MFPGMIRAVHERSPAFVGSEGVAHARAATQVDVPASIYHIERRDERRDELFVTRGAYGLT